MSKLQKKFGSGRGINFCWIIEFTIKLIRVIPAYSVLCRPAALMKQDNISICQWNKMKNIVIGQIKSNSDHSLNNFIYLFWKLRGWSSILLTQKLNIFTIISLGIIMATIKWFIASAVTWLLICDNFFLLINIYTLKQIYPTVNTWYILRYICIQYVG